MQKTCSADGGLPLEPWHKPWQRRQNRQKRDVVNPRKLRISHQKNEREIPHYYCCYYITHCTHSFNKLRYTFPTIYDFKCWLSINTRTKTSCLLTGTSWLVRQFLDYCLAQNLLPYWISHEQGESLGWYLTLHFGLLFICWQRKQVQLTQWKIWWSFSFPLKSRSSPNRMSQKAVLTLSLNLKTQPLKKCIVNWVRVENLPKW